MLIQRDGKRPMQVFSKFQVFFAELDQENDVVLKELTAIVHAIEFIVNSKIGSRRTIEKFTEQKPILSHSAKKGKIIPQCLRYQIVLT